VAQALTHSKPPHRAALRLREHFKDQLDSLRKLRDLQVQEKTLKRMKTEIRFQKFMKFIDKKQKREKKSVRKGLRKINATKIGCRLLRFGKKLMTSGSESEITEKELTGVLSKEFLKFSKDAEKARSSNPRTLHAARIQFKKYRYSWETIRRALPLPAPTVKKMKLLQTLLGDIQDGAVMIRSLRHFKSKSPEVFTRDMAAFCRNEERLQKMRIKTFNRAKNRLVSAIRFPTPD
jgi:CHAD domain-containing protein